MDFVRPAAEVLARGKHSATLVFLHGRGDLGYTWSMVLAEALSARSIAHLRTVCPHAKVRRCTVDGAVCPAWYDTKHLRDLNGFDPVEVAAAAKDVHRLLDEESSRLSSVGGSERLVLAGFSQGGALALYTALAYHKRLAGVALFAAYAPCPVQMAQAATGANKRTPVFQGHGADDPHVRKQLADDTRDALRGLCDDYTLKLYPGLQHAANDEMLDDFCDKLNTWLPAL